MLPNYIVKRKSNIHGFGLFTNKDIKSGDVVWIRDNTILKITLEQFDNLEGEEKDKWIKYSYYENGYVCIGTDDDIYMNHSSDPNCVDFGETCNAIKDIKKDDEITIDYHQWLRPNEKPDWFM